jgi:flavin-dependent dehydrogenase
MPAVTRSLMSDDSSSAISADDGEHRPTHRAVGVDLILDADEAHTEMVEFLQSRQQQMACAAREAIKFPDQHTIDFVGFLTAAIRALS